MKKNELGQPLTALNSDWASATYAVQLREFYKSYTGVRNFKENFNFIRRNFSHEKLKTEKMLLKDRIVLELIKPIVSDLIKFMEKTFYLEVGEMKLKFVLGSNRIPYFIGASYCLVKFKSRGIFFYKKVLQRVFGNSQEGVTTDKLLDFIKNSGHEIIKEKKKKILSRTVIKI